MIEIKLASKEKIIEICDKHNLKFDSELQIYVAAINGETLGFCGFKYRGEEGEIVFCVMNDEKSFLIEDGLLRSSLSLMYEAGVAKVKCHGGVAEKSLLYVGFKQNDGVYVLDLNESFLTQSCCAKSKKNAPD